MDFIFIHCWWFETIDDLILMFSFSFSLAFKNRMLKVRAGLPPRNILKAFAMLTGLKQNSIILAFFLLADADFFYTCIAAYFNTLSLFRASQCNFVVFWVVN